MAHCLQMYLFFLCVNLFLSVSVQTENVPDISNNQFQEISHRITNDSENTHLLKALNVSNYDYECNCGYYSTGCSWSYGEKTCFCKDGYAQNIDTCEQCYCGYNARGCSFINFEKVCDCKIGYGANSVIGYCQNCDCGNENIGCSFKNFEKTCRCPDGTAQKRGKCEKCDCGRNSHNCHFENDEKVCSCLEKYKQNYADECEKCDCGYNSESCEFKGFSKVCTCNNEYIYDESSGECERCDCGPMGISCRLVSDKYTKYTRCTCSPGYVAERDRFEMDEHCSLQGPSGWRIATYIESVFFGIIILICTVNICCKRMS